MKFYHNFIFYFIFIKFHNMTPNVINHLLLQIYLDLLIYKEKQIYL
jgi:hypothetical protein